MRPRSRRGAATPRPGSFVTAAASILLLLLAVGCARPGVERAPAPSPLYLSGQRVLLLPVQRLAGIPAEARERVDAELRFALGEHDASVRWIEPAELRRALQRSPGLAGDPAALPADPLFHRRASVAGEPLASELRRYSALVDARLVLLPHSARFLRGEGATGALHLGVALLDARSGRVLWWGEAAGENGESPGPAAIASASAALAARLLVTPDTGTPP